MFKKLGKKTKALGVIATGFVAAANANAAVSYDAVTNSLSGDIDLTTYYSALPIVFGVIGAVIATTLAIKALRHSK